jgi:hypothetical protein
VGPVWAQGQSGWMRKISPPHWDSIPTPSIPYRVTTPEDVRYTIIHIRHKILISGKLRYLATPFPGDVRENNFYYNSYRKIQQMQQCTNIFIIPYLCKAQHVSGDTPSIIRSLKLHWKPLVFHTWKVVGHVVGGFWIFLNELYYDAQIHKRQIFTTLTFKPLVLAYSNACKKHTPRDAVYTFRQHGNLLHFSDVIYNLFLVRTRASYAR